MPFPLQQFGVDDLRACSDELRALPGAAGSVADEAQLICEFLYGALVDEDGKPACPLVRLYKTERYGELEPELQDFARGLLDGSQVDDDVRCLTLLGTAGDEPAWNDRARSQGHRAIPLPSEEFVERLPMVAQLIRQLGLELGSVVTPPSGREVVELAQRTNDVFHVAEANGSPYLPAQDFVAAHSIASAVGFGGVFMSGAFFSVVVFSRVPISEPVARTLKILAQPIRIRFLPYLHVLGRRR